MMRELIEYAISMDGMITAERMLYIMDMVEAECEHELGAPLDRESIKYLYITNNPGVLTEMEACCARLFIEKYKCEFDANLLRQVREAFFPSDISVKHWLGDGNTMHCKYFWHHRAMISPFPMQPYQPPPGYHAKTTAP